jgi:hypothetical protein
VLRARAHTERMECLCVVLCVRMFVCMCVCVCAQVCLCACVCECECVSACLCLCVFACARADVIVRACARVRMYACVNVHPDLGASIPSRPATAAQRTPIIAQKSARPPAPVIGLRVHVGAVREQCRHHVRVLSVSGVMERRPPEVERTRARMAGASQPWLRAVAGAWVFLCARARACARVCARVGVGVCA